MNKKAQDANLSQLGMILVIFIGALVGMVLFLPTAQTVGGMVNQQSGVNVTVAWPSAANGTTDMVGQELFGTPLVTHANATMEFIAAGDSIDGNFTITEEVSNGVKTIQLKRLDSALVMAGDANVTYTFGADGYIDNSGARSMAGLITIFFALAVALVVLAPLLKSGLMDLMSR